MTRRTYFVIRLALGFGTERFGRGNEFDEADGGGGDGDGGGRLAATVGVQEAQRALRIVDQLLDRSSEPNWSSVTMFMWCTAPVSVMSYSSISPSASASARPRGRFGGARTAAVAHAHAHHAVVDRGAHTAAADAKEAQASTQLAAVLQPRRILHAHRLAHVDRIVAEARRLHVGAGRPLGSSRQPSRACELSARTREMRPGCDPSARASAGERQGAFAHRRGRSASRARSRQSEGWLACARIHAFHRNPFTIHVRLLRLQRRQEVGERQVHRCAALGRRRRGRWPSRSGMYADGTGARRRTRGGGRRTRRRRARRQTSARRRRSTRSFVRSYQIQSTAALPSSAAAFERASPPESRGCRRAAFSARRCVRSRGRSSRATWRRCARSRGDTSPRRCTPTPASRRAAPP